MVHDSLLNFHSVFLDTLYTKLCCWRCSIFLSIQVFQHSGYYKVCAQATQWPLYRYFNTVPLLIQVLQDFTVYCTFAPKFYFPCLLSCLAWQARMKVISPCSCTNMFLFDLEPIICRSVSNPIVHEI
jgi:hypothetical protein